MVESSVTSKGEIKRNIQRFNSFKTNCMSLKHTIIFFIKLSQHPRYDCCNKRYLNILYCKTIFSKDEQKQIDIHLLMIFNLIQHLYLNTMGIFFFLFFFINPNTVLKSCNPMMNRSFHRVKQICRGSDS